ncbi:MAG TPA: phosphatidylserine decarboxylase family protein [Bacteroidia bacterium]|nr:phosphatidylserine decarboxylase family protein [Bacteroidia bacterium]
MKIHREGTFTITVTIIFILAVNTGMFLIFPSFGVWNAIALVLTLALLYIILQFFRNPPRVTPSNPEHIIAPADGKVVVMEEVEEPEYFQGKRLQLSIFMSPFNVHVNRYPIGGTVSYVKYHKGLYLVAWHPKSSTDNERSTVVVKDEKGREVLFRQIAGALAKRIVCYPKAGDAAVQGNEMGFIKFGSRVDVFLPTGTKVNVKLNETVRGGETVIASFS